MEKQNFACPGENLKPGCANDVDESGSFLTRTYWDVFHSKYNNRL